MTKHYSAVGVDACGRYLVEHQIQGHGGTKTTYSWTHQLDKAAVKVEWELLEIEDVVAVIPAIASRTVTLCKEKEAS